MAIWLIALAVVFFVIALLCLAISIRGGIGATPSVMGAALADSDMAPLEVKRRRGREGVRAKFKGATQVTADRVTVEHERLQAPVHSKLYPPPATASGRNIYLVVTEHQHQASVIPTVQLLTGLVQERGVKPSDVMLWGRDLHTHLTSVARDMGVVTREVPGVLNVPTFALVHGDGRDVLVLGKNATLHDYDKLMRSGEPERTIVCDGKGLDMRDDDWWATLNAEMPRGYDTPFLWRAARLDRTALWRTILLAGSLDRHPEVAAGDDALWAAATVLDEPLHILHA